MEADMREKIMKLYEDMSREELILMVLAAKSHDEGIRPQRVSIEAEEMKKIEEILRVFGAYIAGQNYFDVLVSKKFGVIRPDIQGQFLYFYDADSLFYRLIDEIFDDVRELQLDGPHMTNTMSAQEEKEVCARVLPLLNQLQDRTHYNEIFERFLIECKEVEG